jgi:hypothetical protein
VSARRTSSRVDHAVMEAGHVNLTPFVTDETVRTRSLAGYGAVRITRIGRYFLESSKFGSSFGATF